MAYAAMLDSEQERTKFEQLYTAYRQVMFYTANGVLRDPALAEDAVHQAFLRVMDHMANIAAVDCPQTKSFMVIIVRNIAINLYNNRKRKPAVSLDEVEDWTADMRDSPVTAVESQDGYQRLIDLIHRMPEGYRDVLLLKYDNGYTTIEIAAMLGLTEENVKKRLQRARKKLELALSQEEVIMP